MTVRALPKIRFQHPEVQQAYDALSQAMQEGNGERGDPKNRWLTVGDAFNGNLTTLIFGGGDGSGTASGAAGILPTGAIPTGPVGAVIDGLIESVRKDPFFISLGQKIDIINGPDSLPDSVRGQLAATRGDLQVTLDKQGSSITTLETVTSTQATQITTLQTNVNGNSSAIITLNQTTATQATQINALATRTSNAESSIVTLNSTTANQASQLSTLNTTVNGQSASIQQFSQTLYTPGTGLSAQYSVKIDNSGAVSGFGLASDSSLGSRFYIRADRFAIGSPGSGDSGSDANVPFIVQTGSGWWGGPGVFIKQAAIAYATIDTLRVGGNAVTTMAFASSGGGYTNGAIYLPNGAQGLFFLGIAGVSENGGTYPVQANFQLKFNGGEIANGGNSIYPGWGEGIVQNAWLGAVGGGYFGFEGVVYKGGGAGGLHQWNTSVVCIALMR